MVIYKINVCYKYGEQIAIVIKITKIHNVSTLNVPLYATVCSKFN